MNSDLCLVAGGGISPIHRNFQFWWWERPQLVEQVHDLPVQLLNLFLHLIGQDRWLLVGWGRLLVSQLLGDPQLHAWKRSIHT